jgi:peptide subunit release factor 1 (eRF1)
VSLYLPAKENLNKTQDMLTGELSGAAGIKSKQTKNSVMTAISTC